MTIQQILKQYWGYDSFRTGQEEIIQSVLAGKDVLALMPTGGGKSLCYQVPAMYKDGLCLVISPLIALMKDQVEGLRKKSITAFAIYAGMKRNEVINILQTACNSNCKFLYVSPERLETALFKEYLPALNVQLIAVDEAHCISQWGYDFRPPYLRIAALREELTGVPILALTASATPTVQEDICNKLRFAGRTIFRQSFARENLSYSVFKTAAKINKLVEILQNVPGSGIVYCKSRRRTKEIAEHLNSYHIQSDYYHAGLTADQRTKKQEDWIKNNTRIIVCTNAFGMGIDKPDVRVVVHIDMPDCLENYYQEAGRAGRDQKKSYAVLLYEEDEPTTLREQIAQRFPEIETIREVYQSIANYLQLPSGMGEGNYFDFDLSAFMQKFNQPIQQVMNVLKVLEQEGYMSFSEQVFVPSKLQFICSKETLYEFEKEYAALEPLIKLLLRSYEGIFDREVTIYEKQLAGWLKEDIEVIKRKLTELHRFHIIEYNPQKDTPQLYLLQPRMPAGNVRVNEVNYSERKKQYEDRVETFIEYVTDTTGCRSRRIGSYFGDKYLKDCGVCDNCLRQRRLPLNEKEFDTIKMRIEEKLSGGTAINTRELISAFRDISKEKMWQVIELLQGEGKLMLNKDGMVRWLNG